MKIRIITILLFALLVCYPSMNVKGQGIFFWPYRIMKIYNVTHTSDEEMAEKVHGLMVMEDEQHEVCDNASPYSIRLNYLVRNIQPSNCLPLNFKVYYDNATLNAFAAPDGSIRVYSALMDLLNDEELYGVLAHEIGHIAKKHSKNNYIKSVKLSVFDSDPILSKVLLFTITNSFLEAHYSQEQEMEADDYAYRMMKKKGVTPCALVSAFSKLLSFMKENNPDYRDGGILSTHPSFDKRIDALTTKINRDGIRCN